MTDAHAALATWDSLAREFQHGRYADDIAAALRETLAENERLTLHQPDCDGGCGYDGPDETCSLHGRPVAEVWTIARGLSEERDAASAAWPETSDAESA